MRSFLPKILTIRSIRNNRVNLHLSCLQLIKSGLYTAIGDDDMSSGKGMLDGGGVPVSGRGVAGSFVRYRNFVGLRRLLEEGICSRDDVLEALRAGIEREQADPDSSHNMEADVFTQQHMDLRSWANEYVCKQLLGMSYREVAGRAYDGQTRSWFERE